MTGVPAESIREVARAYATTGKAGIYYTLGITEHTCGTDNVYALSNLVLMTGHLGRRSAGMNPLRGQNNVQGANDSGCDAGVLPRLPESGTIPAVLDKFGRAWGVPQTTRPGLNLNEMMKAMGDGRIRGLFLMGEDILVSEPNVGRVEEAMNELDFVVVQDIFFNESCRFADVILPAACFRREGGRVHQLRSSRAEGAQGGRASRAGTSRLGDPARHHATGRGSSSRTTPARPRSTPRWPPWPPSSPASRTSGSSEKGASNGPVETPGVTQYRVPAQGRDPAGQGVSSSRSSFAPPFEEADPEYPLILSTGRTLYHYNVATQDAGATKGLIGKQPEAFVEIHPRDARRLEVVDGEQVDVVSRRGRVAFAVAMVSRQVRRGGDLDAVPFPREPAPTISPPRPATRSPAPASTRSAPPASSASQTTPRPGSSPAPTRRPTAPSS